MVFNQAKQGFTLIELLVVVLIIGILAAVALPQYQQAVEKTRIANLLPILRAIDNAQKTYYLSNGNYADDFSKLDIDVPAGFSDAQDSIFRHYGHFTCWLTDASSFSCQSKNGPRLEKYYHVDFMYCWHNQDARLKRICQSLLNSTCGGARTCEVSF